MELIKELIVNNYQWFLSGLGVFIISFFVFRSSTLLDYE